MEKKDSFKNDFCKSFPELAVAILDFLHEDWCTIGSRSGNRGEEVLEWLSRHPETIKFVCIDDSSRGLETFPHIHAVPSRGFGLLEMRMMVSFFLGKEWIKQNNVQFSEIDFEIKKLLNQKKFVELLEK